MQVFVGIDTCLMSKDKQNINFKKNCCHRKKWHLKEKKSILTVHSKGEYCFWDPLYKHILYILRGCLELLGLSLVEPAQSSMDFRNATEG